MIAIAPFCDREAGIRVTDLMTQRPAIYRGFRFGDALALAIVGRRGAHRDAGGRGGAGRGRRGRALGGEGRARLPEGRGSRDPPQGRTRHPAARSPAGDRRSLHRGAVDPGGLPSSTAATGPGGAASGRSRVDGIAVSGRWVAYRTRRGGRDLIKVRKVSHLGVGGASGIVFGKPRVVAGAPRRGGLSRPSIYRRTLVYSSSSRRRSTVVERLLGSGRQHVLLGSRRWLVSEPSVWARSFAYVRTTNERQQLRVRRRHGRGIGKLVLSLPATSFRDRDHDPGHHRLPTRLHPPDRRRSAWNLIATSIAPGRVYATLLQEGPRGVRARILRTGR